MVTMRDPVCDPRPGDVLESFNDLLGITIRRTVVRRQGCSVLFNSNESLYSCCVDLWKVMNKNGRVIAMKV